MTPFMDIVTPDFLIGYTLLSVYAATILVYEELKSAQTVKKGKLAKTVFIGFTPMNVIVAFFWTLSEILSNLYNYTHKREVIEANLKEARQENIFAFMKYKGIEMSELDDYIESRSMMKKMTDKIQ